MPLPGRSEWPVYDRRLQDPEAARDLTSPAARGAMSYRVAGLTLRSEILLPELAFGDAKADWVVVVRTQVACDDCRAVSEVRAADGGPWMSILRCSAGYVVRFAGLADFRINVRQRQVECSRPADVTDNTFRHLLLDQLVPHLIALDGTPVLHGSAVTVAGASIAFVGPSGAGKSSLAASFVTDGAALLSDDFLPVTEHAGRQYVTPSYPGLRLWPDSMAVFGGERSDYELVSNYHSKARLPVASPGAVPDRLVLDAIIVVDEVEPADGNSTLARMSGAAAYFALFQQAFRLERSGQDRQRDELDRFSRLVGSIPVFRLQFKRDFALLGEVRSEILRAVEGLNSGP